MSTTITAEYLISCGSCGHLLLLPVGQTTGNVPCTACPESADVAHALRHMAPCG